MMARYLDLPYDSMVHYDPTPCASPSAPALCPKCGSHRIEIVGKSQSGAVLILRCNACGERSEIANPAQDDHAAPAAADVASLMKGFIVGGDFRRRARAGWMRA